MFDHLAVVVSDLAKSKAFYARALVPTGHTKVVEAPDPHDADAQTFGFCHDDGSDLWIGQGDATKPPVHIAFRVPSRAAVDAFYAAALAAGGTHNGAPGLRPHYHADYYAAYVLDPDGHNIEAVCHDPE